MIGNTLSHYKIISKLGQGGMGEVYLAEDSRLDRKVALKILPQHLSDRAELRERFEREARAVSSLNHPHICTLYDIGEQDGIHFLVMEHLVGETLEAKLAKGALPLEQTLEYAIQIADALDKAHRQGVVHRDLKPGNIMLVKSGAKLLDFGLAKLQAAETPTNLSALPTEQANLTAEGTILGTLQYMAPEQLEAKEADSRTDIFAFGAVVYEMATGKKAFEGKSQASLIAAIMGQDPRPMAELQPMTPATLDHVVRRCMSKAPEGRWQAASDVMAELRWVTEVGTSADSLPAVTAPAAWRRAIPWGIAATTVVAAVVVVAAVMSWSDSPAIPSVQPVTQFEITLPSTSPLGFGATYAFDPTLITLSPDGKTLVFVGKTGEGTQLYLRTMDSLEITPIAGTEGAWHPFFSPDSNWVGFLTEDRVKKISLRGGGPITLCEAPTLTRATWTRDDMIYFGSNEGSVLNSVPANGGDPKLIVDLRFPSDDRPSLRRGFAEILPDGQSALVIVRLETSISGDFARIYALSLETLEEKLLIEGGYGARYVPSGHLLFARTGVLMAVPFDLERLEVQGEPQVVLKGVSLESLFGQVQVSFSDTGTLVYSPGGDAAVGRIARVDRQGKTDLLPVPERVYGVFDLSPDNQRLAVQVADVNDYVWIYDLQRGEGRRLAGTRGNGWPKWNPSGDSIAFSVRGGEQSLIVERHFDPQEERQLIASDTRLMTDDWSPDGSILSVSDFFRGSIGFVSTGREPEVDWMRPPPGVQYWGSTFSPDGRWVAYKSDETGQSEIWVRSFPDGEQVHQVSTGGGMEPVWTGSGELFYHAANRWMVVRVSTNPQLQWEPPQLAFETEYVDTPGVSYDISSDGRYLYVVKSAHPPDPTRLYVVQNWFEELKRLAPTDN